MNLQSQDCIELLKKAENYFKLAKEQTGNRIANANNAKDYYQQMLSKKCKIDDSLKSVYLGIAESYFILGTNRTGTLRADLQLTITHCSSAIRIDSNYASAYKIRGMANLRLQNYENAQVDFEKLNTLNKLDNEVVDSLAFIYYKRKLCSKFNTIHHLYISNNIKRYHILCVMEQVNGYIQRPQFSWADQSMATLTDLITSYDGSDRNTFTQQKSQLIDRLISRLLNFLERNPTNITEKEILVKYLPTACSDVLEAYLSALGNLNDDETLRELDRLRPDCDNADLGRRIDNFRRPDSSKARSYFNAAQRAFQNNQTPIDDSYEDLERAFKLDPSYANHRIHRFDFRTKKNITFHQFKKFSELYLDYTIIPDTLYQILDEKQKLAEYKCEAIWLLAINDSRDKVKSSKSIREKFIEILIIDPSFSPFYFKNGDDISARFYFAQACDTVAIIKKQNLSISQEMVHKGIQSCEEILKISPSHQETIILRGKLISKLSCFNELTRKISDCQGKIESQNSYLWLLIILILILIAIIIFLCYWNSSYNFKRKIHKNALIKRKIYVADISYKKLKSNLDPLFIFSNKKNFSQNFFEPLEGKEDDKVVSSTQLFFEILLNYDKQLSPSKVEVISKNELEFIIDKIPKLKKYEKIYFMYEGSKYGLKIIIKDSKLKIHGLREGSE